MGPPNRYPRRCSPCPHPRGLPCFHLRFILLLMFFFYRPPPCSAQRNISNTHIQTTFWLLKRGRASTSQVQALACRKMHTSIFRHRTKCLLPNRNLPTDLGPSPFRRALLDSNSQLVGTGRKRRFIYLFLYSVLKPRDGKCHRQVHKLVRVIKNVIQRQFLCQFSLSIMEEQCFPCTQKTFIPYYYSS